MGKCRSGDCKGGPECPESEATEPLKMGRIVGDGIECPYCLKRSDIRAIEDVTIERKVTGIRPNGTIKIDGHYTSEGWDEAATNPRYFCGECCTEFQMPEGIEVDYV